MADKNRCYNNEQRITQLEDRLDTAVNTIQKLTKQVEALETELQSARHTAQELPAKLAERFRNPNGVTAPAATRDTSGAG